MTTMSRLLAEHEGDPVAALEHACRSLDWALSQLSYGLVRPPKVQPGLAKKPRVEPLDISREQHPL